jgi:predicted Zn-dependent peptidase
MRLARDEPFTDEEIARAKRILLADWVFGHERVHQIALTAGFSLALFDLEHPERQLRAMTQCDAATLRAAARRHLDPERGALLAWSLPETPPA